MRLQDINTPLTRFTVPALIVVAVTVAIAVAGLQPATGWTGTVSAWRSPFEAGAGFWMSLLVGFGASMVSAWVWALKPADPAAILFAVSGLTTLMFSAASAVWLFALPISEATSFVARVVNCVGASGFGIVMMCLFMIYPARLPGWKAMMAATVIGFGGITIWVMFGPNPNFLLVHPITFWEMVGIVALVGWQIFATRAEPAQRSIALWLGAAVVLGAGGFISTVAFPHTFGFPPLLNENIAFGFFLLIYAALTVGLMRFRVFGLGGWAFQLMFHFLAAMGVLLLDVLLIGLLSFEPGAAFSIALLLAAAIYLPVRSFAWRKLSGQSRPDEAEMFRAVIDIALTPGGEQRAERWRRLMKDMFGPLEIRRVETEEAAVRIEDEGTLMVLPGVADSPALSLRYKDGGRGLYSPKDMALARQIVKLMRYAEQNRNAYDRGVSEERARIARDIHDNIGAQLLRALHSRETGRKDAMIRETLTDIRDVINNAQGAEAPMEDVLADLRAETADRLDPHGISLSWNLYAAPGALLSRQKVHALRALIREAVSNTIKHAGARAVEVTIRLDKDWLSLRVKDDGKGLPAQTASLGNGLGNMKIRVESFGGDIALEGGEGTSLAARIPVFEMAAE
ncbi:sensor histidine kinase [Hyphomonas sediminis]|uniref:sensor histidine kinase n=1 Tax=Hyphomonas sediminis TaxID=2866160 RepID=UPI001CEC8231|nr:ATP-binding protein [Hyphomonas sediminis]